MTTPKKASTKAKATPKTTKAATVVDLLRRKEGATISDLAKATGWQPHSVRAVLSGLRKTGHTIEKSKRGETTCYRITVSA